MPEQTALFDFMVVRAPESLSEGLAGRAFVRDRLEGPGTSGEADDLVTVSPIAAVIAAGIAARGRTPIPEAMITLRDALLEAHAIARRPVFAGPLPEGETGPPAATTAEWEAGAHLEPTADEVYLVPDSLARIVEQVGGSGVKDALDPLARCLPEIEQADTQAAVGRLAARLDAAIGPAQDLVGYVFGADAAFERWGAAQRRVYDALYLLYIVTRWTQAGLDPLLRALRALHVVESVAADQLVRRLRGRAPGPPEALDEQNLQRASRVFPELGSWSDRAHPPPGFPRVDTLAELEELRRAQILVHPLFARLFHYTTPFNPIRPIGCGELMVVREELTAYRLGEISHIHNIMDKEHRSREHRRLEKTEEVFSLTGSSVEENSKDTQSTDRLEVKNEAEQVIKTSLNVNANANLTYNNSLAKITASAGAGFAYQRASEDHVKTAQNFARDVVAKAVERVERRTSTQRTTTMTFETEEKNLQEVNNIAGKGHVSGIYRWVDKTYTAQVYSYGRRVMYEFLIPDPAAFWIQSRLHAASVDIDVPQPPKAPTLDEVDLGFTAAEVDDEKYWELAQEYDLQAFPIPPATREVALVPGGGNDGYIRGKDVSSEFEVHGTTRDCRVEGAKGYELAYLEIDGQVDFNGQRNQNDPADWNRLTVSVDGRVVAPLAAYNEYWWIADHFGTHHDVAVPPLVLTSDTISLSLLFRFKVNNYGLVIGAGLHLGAAARLEWQQKVHDVVHAAESRRVEARNAEKQAAHDAAMAEYRNRLSQLAALHVGDFLRGGAEAANKALMDEEIKKHCLTMLTLDFDASHDDDSFTTTEALGTRTIKGSVSRRFVVTETEGQPTTAGFVAPEADVTLPAIDIPKARSKGSAVQFLEQAFEWPRMSYIFYPYFWAGEKRWLDLMTRGDDADRAFGEFLRAGMCRVLLAVSEGYDGAVSHYLGTGEAWNGGCAPPLIDDPLFVPLFAEVAERLHDDRDGGTAEGEPWTYHVPTSLVYLHGSTTPMVDLEAERPKEEPQDGKPPTGGGERAVGPVDGAGPALLDGPPANGDRPAVRTGLRRFVPARRR